MMEVLKIKKKNLGRSQKYPYNRGLPPDLTCSPPSPTFSTRYYFPPDYFQMRGDGPGSLRLTANANSPPLYQVLLFCTVSNKCTRCRVVGISISFTFDL